LCFIQDEFGARELDRLRRAVLEAYVGGASDRDAVRAAILDGEERSALERAEAAIAAGARDWWVGEDADPADVSMAWRHACALHIKVRALNTELREAELDFGRDFTEGNFLRIVEIQRQMATAEGAEASIEGFGGASGRTVRPM